MISSKAAETILSSIREDDVTAVVMDLVSIPSPPRRERAAASFVLGWFRNHGIEAQQQQIAGDRCNVVGMIKGQGGGRSLTLNGHIDTAFAGEEDDGAVLGPETGAPEYQPRAFLK